MSDKDVIEHLTKELHKSQKREKYWQEMTGEFASYAYRMYCYVKQSLLSSNEVDHIEEMRQKFSPYIDFRED